MYACMFPLHLSGCHLIACFLCCFLSHSHCFSWLTCRTNIATRDRQRPAGMVRRSNVQASARTDNRCAAERARPAAARRPNGPLRMRSGAVGKRATRTGADDGGLAIVGCGTGGGCTLYKGYALRAGWSAAQAPRGGRARCLVMGDHTCEPEPKPRPPSRAAIPCRPG